MKRFALALLLLAAPLAAQVPDSVLPLEVEVVPDIHLVSLLGPARLKIGDTATVRIQGWDSNGDAVPVVGTLVSSDPTILSVISGGIPSDSARIIAHKRGKVTLTVTDVDLGDYVYLTLVPEGAPVEWASLRAADGATLVAGTSPLICGYTVRAHAVTARAPAECPLPDPAHPLPVDAEMRFSISNSSVLQWSEDADPGRYQYAGLAPLRKLQRTLQVSVD